MSALEFKPFSQKIHYLVFPEEVKFHTVDVLRDFNPKWIKCASLVKTEQITYCLIIYYVFVYSLGLFDM